MDALRAALGAADLRRVAHLIVHMVEIGVLTWDRARLQPLIEQDWFAAILDADRDGLHAVLPRRYRDQLASRNRKPITQRTELTAALDILATLGDPEIQRYYSIPYRNVTRPVVSLWEIRAAKAELIKGGRAKIDERTLLEGGGPPPQPRQRRVRADEGGPTREHHRVTRYAARAPVDASMTAVPTPQPAPERTGTVDDIFAEPPPVFTIRPNTHVQSGKGTVDHLTMMRPLRLLRLPLGPQCLALPQHRGCEGRLRPQKLVDYSSSVLLP
jgi:hypothetical protein